MGIRNRHLGYLRHTRFDRRCLVRFSRREHRQHLHARRHRHWQSGRHPDIVTLPCSSAAFNPPPSLRGGIVCSALFQPKNRQAGQSNPNRNRQPPGTTTPRGTTTVPPPTSFWPRTNTTIIRRSLAFARRNSRSRLTTSRARLSLLAFSRTCNRTLLLILLCPPTTQCHADASYYWNASHVCSHSPAIEGSTSRRELLNASSLACKAQAGSTEPACRLIAGSALLKLAPQQQLIPSGRAFDCSPVLARLHRKPGVRGPPGFAGPGPARI